MLRRLTFPVFNAWAAELPAPIAADIEAGIGYLLEHGRGAVLPDVRLRIQQSDHYPDLAEVRVDGEHEGNRHAYRVLACFVHDDEGILVCIGGDKHHYLEQTHRDWYDDYVPVADEIVNRFLQKGVNL